MHLDATQLTELARAVIRTEADAVVALADRLDDAFVAACQHLHACRGRIVVLGMGKSGHVGSKIAATLASTGSPAFFVHPGEASHGDLGMIVESDVVLALSNSGETNELLTILPIIRRLGVPLIALTGNPRSSLAREATVHIDVSVEREACPLGLAPTSSTTAALVMGDALAIALLEARGFTAEDFARSHPGGRLGRRLLLHVADIMHRDDAIPAVAPDTPLGEALLEITRKNLGMTAIVDAERRICGVFTDGDLRRTLNGGHGMETRIDAVMTPDCRTIQPGMLAAEAVKIMEDNRITALPVTDADGHLVGALNMQDLLRAGVV
ncbi:KpsF/GutQ family sugar-phosphate isomerase [Acidihalobacter ferrooxydans]|uniref:Arabinose 5-phosphate isomerase n=1 Tax=Acidihalobacter ferrooxydans TaxID=1765967 RepID=A0A1P8UJG8_9GAMM|nr:KpsF/GutQ family sugar-phosphate isomerase [Acidihalobacter ferrooxydans]APZ43931.1 D-arabinose 5-phosphate isomerase [Acidihalobacter ferrooxydans]